MMCRAEETHYNTHYHCPHSLHPLLSPVLCSVALIHSLAYLTKIQKVYDRCFIHVLNNHISGFHPDYVN